MNLRPNAYEALALTTELRRLINGALSTNNDLRPPYTTIKISNLADCGKKNRRYISAIFLKLLRGLDLNQRPSGYEPDELTAAPPRDINAL
ncbi:MAG: hypothetical protein Athens071426_269 [Parcubacteria group bacterium Athens0714_26]|nr:MAG: hypothetical protein Athens101426_497 [Parcubacteria group bacterium Athens1014_26]TSD03247.1 MAG: hypothetical protein Athens071426_269 [Parcubacteria group bacterium Athens0714_26]